MRARNKARDSQQQHGREVLQQYQRLRIIVTDSLKDRVFSSSPLCIFLTSEHLPPLLLLVSLSWLQGKQLYPWPRGAFVEAHQLQEELEEQGTCLRILKVVSSLCLMDKRHGTKHCCH